MQATTWSSMQYPFSSTDSAIIKDDNSSISYPCMYLLADADRRQTNEDACTHTAISFLSSTVVAHIPICEFENG